MLIVLRSPRYRLWFSDSFESVLMIRSTGKTHPPPCIFCMYVCVSRSHCCSHSSLRFVTVATHSQARQSCSFTADARGKGVFALTQAACV